MDWCVDCVTISIKCQGLFFLTCHVSRNAGKIQTSLPRKWFFLFILSLFLNFSTEELSS